VNIIENLDRFDLFPNKFDWTKSYGENRRQYTESFERRYISELLKRHRGNISKAAREARMDRKHLHDLCLKHGITSDIRRVWSNHGRS